VPSHERNPTLRPEHGSACRWWRASCRRPDNRLSVAADPQERLAKIGLEVVASSPSELADVLKRDVPKWGNAVKDSGAVAD
jgi:hypothetical protein